MANPRIPEPVVNAESKAAPVVVEEQETQFNLPYFKKLFDIRNMVDPWTARKGIFYTAYTGIAGSVAAAQVNTNFMYYLLLAARAELWPLMGVLYAAEPLYFASTMFFTSYPPLTDEQRKILHEAKVRAQASELALDLESQLPQLPYEPEVPPGNENMALVIAAHESAGFIAHTIRAALKVLKPEQIFVIDNARTETPPDETRAIIHAINPKVRYHYHPYGNKTVAHYIGTLLAKDYKYILYTDDDVHVPPEFRMETHLFNDIYKMIVYRIRAMRKDGEESFLVGWQDIEYMLAGAGKTFQDRFHGALYHHGAVYASEREFALEVFYRHTTTFIAEDVRGGLIKEALGKRAHVGSYYFPTLVPTTYFGTAPNKLNQRLTSWNFGAQTLTGEVMWALATEWTWPPSDLAVLKYNQVYFLYNNLMDWLRPVTMAIAANDPLYWARLGGVMLLQQLMVLYFNHIHLRHRPDLQQPFKIAATKFIDNIFESIVTTLSLIRFVFIYLPGYVPKLTIPELDKRGDFDYLREGEEGMKYLTHVRIPTRLYSKIDEALGRWEIVMKAVTEKNLKEMEDRLEKAAVDLAKQAIGTENKAQYAALYTGTLVLALLIAKILMNVLEGFRNKLPTNTEIGLDFAMIALGILGGMITAYLINASMTANDLSRVAKIGNSRLALFHQPVTVPMQSQPSQLTHRKIGRPSLSSI